MQRGGTSPGTAWSFSTSRDKGTSDNSLYGVSCGSATSCQAVGDFENVTANPEAFNTLVESWHGGTWSVSSTPNESNSTYQFLAAVSCRTTTFCQAVGYYQNTSGTYQTLIEKY